MRHDRDNQHLLTDFLSGFLLIAIVSDHLVRRENRVTMSQQWPHANDPFASAHFLPLTNRKNRSHDSGEHLERLTFHIKIGVPTAPVQYLTI